MTLLHDYERVSRNRLCPICQRPDWCLVQRGDPPASAICSRVESPRRWGDAGWHHRLQGEARIPRRRVQFVRRMPTPDGRMSTLATDYERAVMPEALDRLAQSLGLTAESLRRLRIGWTGRNWAFPMVGRDGNVCGIRIRTPSGSKFSEKGGHEGIFVPRDLTESGTLVICEGPTDTAAVLDMGLDAIGRPNCSGGTRPLVDVVRRKSWERHVIFADADGPGLQGARTLAHVLATHARDVRIVVPPEEDTRAWFNGGAGRDDALALIEAAPPIRISVRRVVR